MSDRTTFDAFDAFEERLASAFDRHVALAADPRPASEIAAVAMRPRGLRVGARQAGVPRRLLLLGVAAILLVPAALIGSGSIRPAPPPSDRARPALPGDSASGPLTSGGPVTGAAAIFVRRDEAPEPGVSVFAVRPDGAEILLRHVPDTVIAGGGVEEYGTVSPSGWLALDSSTGHRAWPAVLVDLRHEDAEPWVVTEASTGGIGPRWGPNGLLAAAAEGGGNGGEVVIVDPGTRAVRTVSMHGGLIGGGPSIVWTADGTGIASSSGDGHLQTVPIDGGEPSPGVGDVFDPRGAFGDRLAQLRPCVAGSGCPGGDDGRLDLVQTDGTARTVWRPSGDERLLAASFGAADEYWLTLDSSAGRQVTVVHVRPGGDDVVATVNRDASWQYVGAPTPTPDRAGAVLSVDLGGKAGAVVVPFDGSPPTFHTGTFVGFVDSSTVAPAAGTTALPGATLPPIGAVWALPTLDELIAAELSLNPTERVVAKAGHDGVGGDTATRTTVIQADVPDGLAYLDCRGPASVTASTGAETTTNPCLNAGSSGIQLDPDHRSVTVTARGDTSWRLVVYAPGPPSPGDTPPPVAVPLP